jgi:hypothetical protein
MAAQSASHVEVGQNPDRTEAHEDFAGDRVSLAERPSAADSYIAAPIAVAVRSRSAGSPDNAAVPDDEPHRNYERLPVA